MAQTSPQKAKPRPVAPPSKADSPPPRKDSNRDLVEQIVVALILAFLIRGFEAEAFVIPTGSMAPTLMGRHKDVTCPRVRRRLSGEGHSLPGRVTAGTCLNCRFPTPLRQDPSFKGDRILVMKFPYDLPILPGCGKPERWEVVVFKYPEEPEVNYIKRLVGLPNEELQVHFGDLRVRPLGSQGPFLYPRRPLRHQQAMQMLVWDDTHRPERLKDHAEWSRWAPREPGAWKEEAPYRSGRPWTFSSPESAPDWSELRYRHLVPDPLQWDAIVNSRPLPAPPRPTLITDFYSYNSNVLSLLSQDRTQDRLEWMQPHWVGDLTLAFRLQATAPKGRVRFELVEGGVPNRCEVDLATGLATLWHGDQQLGEPAPTRLKDTGSHDVGFANVDGRLTLWVDGSTPFGEGRVYDDGSAARGAPTAADLDPAGIAARGTAVKVSGLVLKRDIYYTLEPGRSDYSALDLHRPSDRIGDRGGDRVAWLFDVLSDPTRFPELGKLDSRPFKIRPGHYMMMGDNSPRSKDGRGWGQNDKYGYYDPVHNVQVEGWAPADRESWEVPASMLIGKAFFIYWPHGKPFWPDIALSPDFHVPFRPNLERMRWIR